ncbi:MAG: hypothetical protein K0R92_3374 [Lachnospiraceae bacterium]|jgi:hypothetical protein|nr:hypothetical protein [Lachnospiraceae bacterium]
MPFDVSYTPIINPDALIIPEDQQKFTAFKVLKSGEFNNTCIKL